MGFGLEKHSAPSSEDRATRDHTPVAPGHDEVHCSSVPRYILAVSALRPTRHPATPCTAIAGSAPAPGHDSTESRGQVRVRAPRPTRPVRAYGAVSRRLGSPKPSTRSCPRRRIHASAEDSDRPGRSLRGRSVPWDGHALSTNRLAKGHGFRRDLARRPSVTAIWSAGRRSWVRSLPEPLSGRRRRSRTLVGFSPVAQTGDLRTPWSSPRERSSRGRARVAPRSRDAGPPRPVAERQGPNPRTWTGVTGKRYVWTTWSERSSD